MRKYIGYAVLMLCIWAAALELQATLDNVGETIALLAADRELLEAAEATGLLVENPTYTVIH